MSEARDDSAQRSVSQNSKTPSASLWAILAISIPRATRLSETISSKKSTAGCWDRTAELVKKMPRMVCKLRIPPRLSRHPRFTGVVDLSSFYFDVLKRSSLHQSAQKTNRAASAQTAVWKLSSAIVRLAAPILVFTSEEIWKYLLKLKGEPGKRFTWTLFPEAESLACGISKDAGEKWERLAQGPLCRARSSRTSSRRKKSSVAALEAKVHLHAGPEAPGLQKLLEEKLPISARALYRFPGPGRAICHRRQSVPAETLPGLTIKIERADGAKCERCWNYSTHVGENNRYPDRLRALHGSPHRKSSSGGSASVAVT